MKGCRTSGCAELYVPVPQECMGRIIGTGGNNIKQLARETRTRIKTCNEDNVGKGPGFLVIGTPSDCEDAQLAIRRRIVSIAMSYTLLFLASILWLLVTSIVL